MARKRKPAEDDKKIFGKRSAYRKLNDGRIEIWPLYGEQFLEINDRLVALDQLTASVAAYVANERAALSKRNRGVWQQMSDDFGIDFFPGSGWAFDFTKNQLIPPPPEPTDLNSGSNTDNRGSDTPNSGSEG